MRGDSRARMWQEAGDRRDPNSAPLRLLPSGPDRIYGPSVRAGSLRRYMRRHRLRRKGPHPRRDSPAAL